MPEPNEQPIWLRSWTLILGVVLLVLCIGIALVAVLILGLPGRLFPGEPQEPEEVLGPDTPSAESATEPATASDSGVEPTPTPAPPTEAPPTLAGYYGLTLHAYAGNLDHAFRIAMFRWLSVALHQSDITLEGPEPWVDLTGELADDGTLTATGRGTVAGYDDIAVRLEGSLTFDDALGDYRFSGDLIMGAEGGLPGGQSITYSVEGFRIGLLDADPAAKETLEEFLPTLVEAIRGQDVDFMMARAHPAAFAFYGEETCLAYFESIDDPDTNIEPAGRSGEEAWLWEREGLTAYVVQTFYVVGDVTSGGLTETREIHFAPVNGELRWFPDCGDPLP